MPARTVSRQLLHGSLPRSLVDVCQPVAEYDGPLMFPSPLYNMPVLV